MTVGSREREEEQEQEGEWGSFGMFLHYLAGQVAVAVPAVLLSCLVGTARTQL